MYKSIIFTFFLIGLSFGAFAQDFNVNIDKLLTELQKTSEEDDKLTLVWWIPSIFWEASLKNDPTMDEATINEVVEMFNKFEIVGIVDGKIGVFGNVTYIEEEKLRESVSIVDSAGKSYKPMDESLVSDDIKTALAVMKPMFANMLGAMGENFNFYVFPDIPSISENIQNTEKRTSFKINVIEESFTFNLPLESTLKPKTCPVDQEEMSGGWFFCPYHGKELY